MAEPFVKSNDIILYADAINPCAAKVNCFLDYKELEFNVIHVNPVSRREIRFAEQHQVPILRIGEEWRTDSTAIGIWLEERFPERPILGHTSSERALILKMDQWVSASPMAAFWRQVCEGDNLLAWLRNGWRLGAVLNRARRLPLMLRFMWPLLLKVWPSITGCSRTGMDSEETLSAMHERVCREMREWLGRGPFMGELNRPSLADLAAYPQFIMPYLVGLQQDYLFLRVPEVLGWMSRVQKWLPANPLLVPNDCFERILPYFAR